MTIEFKADPISIYLSANIENLLIEILNVEKIIMSLSFIDNSAVLVVSEGEYMMPTASQDRLRKCKEHFEKVLFAKKIKISVIHGEPSGIYYLNSDDTEQQLRFFEMLVGKNTEKITISDFKVDNQHMILCDNYSLQLTYDSLGLDQVLLLEKLLSPTSYFTLSKAESDSIKKTFETADRFRLKAGDKDKMLMFLFLDGRIYTASSMSLFKSYKTEKNGFFDDISSLLGDVSSEYLAMSDILVPAFCEILDYMDMNSMLSYRLVSKSNVKLIKAERSSFSDTSTDLGIGVSAIDFLIDDFYFCMTLERVKIVENSLINIICFTNDKLNALEYAKLPKKVWGQVEHLVHQSCIDYDYLHLRLQRDNVGSGFRWYATLTKKQTIQDILDDEADLPTDILGIKHPVAFFSNDKEGYSTDGYDGEQTIFDIDLSVFPKMPYFTDIDFHFPKKPSEQRGEKLMRIIFRDNNAEVYGIGFSALRKL